MGNPTVILGLLCCVFVFQCGCTEMLACRERGGLCTKSHMPCRQVLPQSICPEEKPICCGLLQKNKKTINAISPSGKRTMGKSLKSSVSDRGAGRRGSLSEGKRNGSVRSDKQKQGISKHSKHLERKRQLKGANKSKLKASHTLKRKHDRKITRKPQKNTKMSKLTSPNQRTSHHKHKGTANKSSKSKRKNGVAHKELRKYSGKHIRKGTLRHPDTGFKNRNSKKKALDVNLKNPLKNERKISDGSPPFSTKRGSMLQIKVSHPSKKDIAEPRNMKDNIADKRHGGSAACKTTDYCRKLGGQCVKKGSCKGTTNDDQCGTEKWATCECCIKKDKCAGKAAKKECKKKRGKCREWCQKKEKETKLKCQTTSCQMCCRQKKKKVNKKCPKTCEQGHGFCVKWEQECTQRYGILWGKCDYSKCHCCVISK